MCCQENNEKGVSNHSQKSAVKAIDEQCVIFNFLVIVKL